MANKKTTKRALLFSVLSMVLCVSMLMGTTFAWFTDSVTSANNIIKSGNLDLEVEYTLDGENWKDLTNASDLFQKSLWEPGHTEVVALKVKNVGSLALKYSANMNIINEVVGKNKDGGDIVLSEILTVGTLVQEANQIGDIAVGLAFNNENMYKGTTAFKSSNVLASNVELLPGSAHYVIIKVDMAETVGNEANHDGVNVPSIDFGINFFATQYTYEEDSFGADYDYDAPIVSTPAVRPTNPTEMNLEGAYDVVITLSKNVINALPAAVTEIGMSVSEPKVVDNKIVFDSIELVDQDGEVIDLDSLNLTEKITVTLPAQTTFASGETVMIYHDGEFVATAVVKANGVISYDVEHLCEVTVGAVEAPVVKGDVVEISTAAQLFGLAQKVNSGADYYAGKTVVLTKDIDLKNANWTPIGSATMEHGFMGNFDGNGFKILNLTIDNPALDSDGYAYAGFFGVTEGTDKDNQNSIKNLVIENVTINTEGHIVAAAIAYPYYTALENITVCGDIAIKGGDYTAGALAYTRRCVDATNITVKGNDGSYITGATTVGGVISDIQLNGGLTANYSNFSASNVTITGNKCVGGISGIIGRQTLNGATVENVELVCSDTHVGIVSGAFDGKPSIENVTYSNVVGTAAIVGAPYGSNSNKSIVIEGVEYVAVSTADELVAALENKSNVIFVDNIKVEPAKMSNAYGKTGINVKYGQTIDGNGYTLDIKGAGGTWDSGINTTGGIIKNITVTGSFRGIFINHTSEYSEKVVLDNVVIGGNGTVYTISCDQGLYQGIEATNCTFNGWTSFAKTAGEAKFVNCTFGEGSGYKYCRPYSNTEFVNCTFCEGYAVDTTRATVTFTGCAKP